MNTRRLFYLLAIIALTITGLLNTVLTIAYAAPLLQADDPAA